MRTIRVIADITYDDEIMHGDDPESKAWFFGLLLNDTLHLHSNEIGDTVGIVRLREITNPPKL